jgi:hypothetical protein
MKVFTIAYLKQTIFLGCIYFCICSEFAICATCNVISTVKYVLYFYISTFHIMCAVPNMAVFSSFIIIIIIIIIIQLLFLTPEITCYNLAV